MRLIRRHAAGDIDMPELLAVTDAIEESRAAVALL
jgi:hypothetical protein